MGAYSEGVRDSARHQPSGSWQNQPGKGLTCAPLSSSRQYTAAVHRPAVYEPRICASTDPVRTSLSSRDLSPGHHPAFSFSIAARAPTNIDLPPTPKSQSTSPNPVSWLLPSHISTLFALESSRAIPQEDLLQPPLGTRQRPLLIPQLPSSPGKEDHEISESKHNSYDHLHLLSPLISSWVRLPRRPIILFCPDTFFLI